jgi:hypothetical protein
MRDRRHEKSGGVFAGIRRGLFRAKNDADTGSSFAAAEWYYSDRLLRWIQQRQTPEDHHPHCANDRQQQQRDRHDGTQFVHLVHLS